MFFTYPLKMYGSHEDWNPMEEDYFNEKFNTYEAGPGADLDRSLQPCFRKRSEIQRPLCKLFVHQIPRTLTEEGLRNLFLKFGIPRSVYLCKKPSPYNLYWALVEYSTVSEGQEAINGLNGRPPLNLSVQFARSDGEKERLRKETEQEYLFRKMSYPLDTSYDLPEMESPYPRAIGRGRGVPMLVSAPSTDSYYPHKPYWLSNDELMFRKPIAKGVFNPYHGSVWDTSNAHVMDEVSLTVNSSEDGRRISMGRGIPWVCELDCVSIVQNHLFIRVKDVVLGIAPKNARQKIGQCIRRFVGHSNLCKKMDSSMTRKEAPENTGAASEETAKKKSEQWGEGKERKGVKREGVHCDGFKRMEGRQLEEAKNLQRGAGREEAKSCQREAGREEAKNWQREAGREEAKNCQREAGREETKNWQRGAGREEAKNWQRGAGREEAKNWQRGAGREEAKNCQRGAGREEAKNWQRGAGREEAKNWQRGAGREEVKNCQRGAGREGKTCQRGGGGEEAKIYRQGEVKNYRRGESREEARNCPRKEEDGWKKKNMERIGDGNRVASSVPDNDDWENDTVRISNYIKHIWV
ncbi:hypothetical protein J437_LFUL018673 [Ladona fulva]|nr:hypothetical protein J437_LFUL018673 [Ladona fulva]